MFGKHIPLPPPQDTLLSAPRDVEEQLEAYLDLNFEEENRGSPDHVFFQDWQDVLKEFKDFALITKTRQTQIYSFCNALSRRLIEPIDIGRVSQWKDLSIKLGQARWWGHYEALQAAHAKVDFKALEKLLQGCRDGAYFVSDKVSHRGDDHSMLDDQTTLDVSEDGERASDDGGTTMADSDFPEELYHSAATGDTDSQLLRAADWWDKHGRRHVMDLNDRKKVYHYNDKGEFVGLTKPEPSDSETQDTSRGSHTDADMEAEEI